MRFRIVAGTDFHSGDELNRLLDSAENEAQSDGAVSAAWCLTEITRGGFNQVRNLLERSTEPNIWIFKDRGFRMALDVPGDGRFQTSDITLVVSEFCEVSTHKEAITRPSFVDTARRRLQTGEETIWTL